MGIDDRVLEEIVRRLLSVGRPERIILFGSAATGKMTRDSDIDLLVLERSPSNTREESLKFRAALRGMGYPFDVIVMADALPQGGEGPGSRWARAGSSLAARTRPGRGGALRGAGADLDRLRRDGEGSERPRRALRRGLERRRLLGRHRGDGPEGSCGQLPSGRRGRGGSEELLRPRRPPARGARRRRGSHRGRRGRCPPDMQKRRVPARPRDRRWLRKSGRDDRI